MINFLLWTFLPTCFGATAGFIMCALLTAGLVADLRARIVELELRGQEFRRPGSRGVA